jgi:small subunit ribosomal protein S16
MIVMRMSRHGTKKRPFFHIVVADSRAPRDGKYIEKVGTYNPLLEKGHVERIKLNAERVQHWLKTGAQPSDRVARFLADAKLGPAIAWRESPKKSAPRAKAQERLKAAAEAANAEKAASEAAPAPEAAAEAAPAA